MCSGELLGLLEKLYAFGKAFRRSCWKNSICSISFVDLLEKSYLSVRGKFNKVPGNIDVFGEHISAPGF